MGSLSQVKFANVLVCTILAACVSGQISTIQNNTKTVDLHDPNVDSVVKSVLENGSVSEVVVRKDLLLFPVNAPDLVIAHSQQIHAVPQNNSTNQTDGRPTTAEVAEVNEYSVSQLVSTNDTETNNESESDILSPPDPHNAQNTPTLEAGKPLEVTSGFNFSDGLATEKVALPDSVGYFNLPKQSIQDILSKSLTPTEESPPTTSTYSMAKRSIPSEMADSEDSDSNSTEASSSGNGKKEVLKRSQSKESESDESDGKDNSEDLSKEGTSSKSLEDDDSSSSTESNESAMMYKREALPSEEDDNDSDSNPTEYYDHEE